MPRHKMVTTRGSRFCSLRRRRYSGSGLRKRARADSRADSLSPSDFNLSSRVEALPILASLGAESCTSISLLRRSNCEVRARLNASSASWRRLRSPVSSAGSSLTEGGWALLAAASREAHPQLAVVRRCRHPGLSDQTPVEAAVRRRLQEIAVGDQAAGRRVERFEGQQATPAEGIPDFRCLSG